MNANLNMLLEHTYFFFFYNNLFDIVPKKLGSFKFFLTEIQTASFIHAQDQIRFQCFTDKSPTVSMFMVEANT